jgi:hypothetical protein
MTLSQVIRVLSVVATLLFGLVFGPVVPMAGADTAAAQLKSATVKKTTLTYTFALQDTEDVGGVWLTVRERDNPDNVIVNGQDVDIHPIPGAFRDITRTAADIPEGTAVCVSVVVWKYVHLGINDDPSPPSNQICTDPETTAKQADVALQEIRGRDDPVSGQSLAYLVLLANPSANEATDVTVDLSTSGVAKFGDQGIVAAGWTNNGFACAPRPPVGGESSAMTCTGGRLKAKDHTDPAVIVDFPTAGIGAIHGQISGAGDVTPGNNGTAHPVQVQQKVG